MMTNPSLAERFWMKVRKTNGCWVWQGATDSGGYGQIGIGHSHPVRAHRVSWQLAFGSIPAGKHVLHTCDNPRCVNPAHLFLGTDADNKADSVRKGRIARGRKIGTAKLTPSQVEEIRFKHSTGKLTERELGNEYGVVHSQINRIVRHHAWRSSEGCE